MAAEKLTKKRLIQIVVMLIILLIAFFIELIHIVSDLICQENISKTDKLCFNSNHLVNPTTQSKRNNNELVRQNFR